MKAVEAYKAYYEERLKDVIALEAQKDDPSVLVGGKFPEHVFLVLRMAKRQPGYFEQSLPSFKRSVEKHWKKRFNSHASDKQTALGYFRFVESVRQAQTRELLDRTKPEWVGRTLLEIARIENGDDAAKCAVDFLSGVMRHPRLVKAYLRTYATLPVSMKMRMRYFSAQNEKIVGILDSSTSKSQRPTDIFRPNLTDFSQRIFRRFPPSAPCHP